MASSASPRHPLMSAPAARRAERLVAILDMVASRGQVSVAELAESLATSRATIRRDILVLADQGVLDRTHGGARGAGPLDERPVAYRDGRFAEAKVRIARAATSYVPAVARPSR